MFPRMFQICWRPKQQCSTCTTPPQLIGELCQLRGLLVADMKGHGVRTAPPPSTAAENTSMVVTIAGLANRRSWSMLRPAGQVTDDCNERNTGGQSARSENEAAPSVTNTPSPLSTRSHKHRGTAPGRSGAILSLRCGPYVQGAECRADGGVESDRSESGIRQGCSLGRGLRDEAEQREVSDVVMADMQVGLES